MNDKLLTVEEVAERLATSPRFVRRLMCERRIVYVRMGRKGSPVRITESDLQAFIESARVERMRVPTLSLSLSKPSVRRMRVRLSRVCAPPKATSSNSPVW